LPQPGAPRQRDLLPRFLVAFSFAGAQRELVRRIATGVKERLGGGTVFLDEWFQAVLAGANGNKKLQDIYLKHSTLVVCCVGRDYDDRAWTRIEQEAIGALQMELSETGNPLDPERILPIRVADGGEFFALLNTIAPDAREKSIEETVELILDRLRLVAPQSLPGAQIHAKPAVYLAESTPDLEEDCARLRIFMNELGWSVLPERPYGEDEDFAAALDRDLARCVAFVQLLGPYAWKRGGFDRLQASHAKDRNLKRFMHRSPDIVLKEVKDEAHRAFLEDVDVLSMGFEDLKQYLRKEIDLLDRRRRASASDPHHDGAPPVVRVMIRSTQADALWEKVFQTFYADGSILPYQLRADESFEGKQQEEPCQGFLVVCDEDAMRDGPHSPRDDIDQCRRIQMRVKDATARPPVGLAYWPPPDPSWPRLLRSQAPKMFRIVGDTETHWSAFFDAVLDLARPPRSDQ